MYKYRRVSLGLIVSEGFTVKVSVLPVKSLMKISMGLSSPVVQTQFTFWFSSPEIAAEDVGEEGPDFKRAKCPVEVVLATFSSCSFGQN